MFPKRYRSLSLSLSLSHSLSPSVYVYVSVCGDHIYPGSESPNFVFNNHIDPLSWAKPSFSKECSVEY